MEGFDRDDVESIASSSVREADQGARCFYNDPSLTSSGSMPYRGFRVGLFVKKVGDTFWIYYEPIAVLDPKSIVVERLSANQFQVNFDLEMWNATLEEQVAKYRQCDRKLIQVMPYEEVCLVQRDKSDGGGAFQLPSRPTSYLQLNERLNFDVVCDSKEIAELVTDTKHLAKKLFRQLKIECRGQATGQAEDDFHHGALGVKRTNRFNFNFISEACVVRDTPRLEQDAINGMKSIVL